MSPRRGALAARVAALATALVVAGCARQPPPRVVDGVARGTTTERFRERWWHFYERGVSWADGGCWREAEADLRAALAQRATDSRRARTYGFHFVQCFAHRELGAVLLATGRLDDAERELRTSLAQEPSAKAEYLLGVVRARRAGARPDAGPPASAADPAMNSARARVEITAIEPVGARLAVRGTWHGARGERLWLQSGDAAVATPIAIDGAGGFAVEADERARLRVAGDDAAAPRFTATLAVLAPAPRPELTLAGPGDDDVLAAERGWWRWTAAAPAGLAALRVRDGAADDAPVVRALAVRGLRAAGMIDAPLTPGDHALVFEAVAADGAVARRTVAVHARPAPSQDRRLRATALLLPLQDPRVGATPRADDDLGVQAALVDDARLRLIDHRVDGWLDRELALVEAGWVAPTTAARAGRRLGARYGVVGTVGRGRGDIECWLRLVQVDSGAVVASADAYAELREPGDEDAFYAAVAARLRQAFPVLAGRLIAAGARAGDPVRIDLGRRDRVATGLRFHVLGDRDVAGEVEITDVVADGSRGRVVDGVAPSGAPLVSE